MLDSTASNAALPKGPPTLAALWTLAWPVVLSRLGIMCMGVTDAIVVGRYSAEELGYQALGWGPTGVVVTTGVGLLMGVQVLTAQLVGEDRRIEAGAVLQRGLLLSLLVGLLATAVLIAGTPPLFRLLGHDPALAAGASEVVVILSLSMTPYLVSIVCSFWLEALERPKPGMYLMLLANMVNLALNIWLVPGTSPFAVDGAVASAWTTFFSRSVYAIALIFVILAWPEARSLGVFLVRKAASWSTYWGRMMRVGWATAASYFVESGGFAGTTLIAGLMGALSVAAFSITFNLAALVFMIPLGMSSATAVFVGKYYGRGDVEGIRSSGILGVGATFIFLLGLAAVIAFVPQLWAGAYTTDPELLALVVPALLAACFFFPVDGLQVVTAASLRAADDNWMPTLTHFISYNLVMLPAAWWFGLELGYGVVGLVWVMCGVSILAAAFLISRFWWITRSAAALPEAA
ncbi:hypothetical protein B5C34_15280 [Pacificimonas flava]|uniref:Multidrug-efflux transporter n=2 Tax=Pacificimonas TaxID=1960290 RepID=A0A219B0I1_9SPHN|nr:MULTISPECIES: MATE family efflux transporter [Pacificimonas]MBZ6379674.1 MATE family efflux transporter [Pacificimonas aurantium]OWV31862.1 hypothetical protein B5C34_15280 [Pacificimonas flava]